MLNINDIDVSRKPVEYICYGLGSCIGLFIVDRVKKITGGAHIPFPFPGGGKLADASRLISELLESFHSQGSELDCLRAKVTGGGQLFSKSLNIGQQNAHVVINELVKRKIYIAASDLGGNVARTARFNSLTNELVVTTSDRRIISL